MNILRSSETSVALERILTRERLQKYLTESAGNLADALALYERNVRLAEAMYTSLHVLEICLRNSIDAQMKATYGDEWLTSNVSPLQKPAADEIRKTRDRLKNPSPSDILADLSFSFWVGLLGRAYDATVWRKAVFKAFPNSGNKSRNAVHGRLNALRRFRNRVAHHEPIFSNADQMHAETIETIGWMCRHTQTWTVQISRFRAISGSYSQ